MYIYTIRDKKTKQIICEGTLKEVAYHMNVGVSSISERYMDRDNKNRFVNSTYTVERRKE